RNRRPGAEARAAGRRRPRPGQLKGRTSVEFAENISSRFLSKERTSMNPRDSRRIWALALALAAAVWAAPDARADAITYGTVGWIETPTGATPNLVYYNGTSGTVTGAGSLNLGQFEVSPAVLNGPNISYAGDPFHVIVYSGPNQSTEISGTLHGSVGPGP